MEWQNILLLTPCTGHQTEFQGGARKGHITKCEKDVFFELKAREQRFGWQYIRVAHTHTHVHTLMLKIEVVLL